jgi:TPR repeat protein
MYNYALCCLRGWGVKKSPQTAFLWLERAAERQFVPAQIKHAELLFNGVEAEESDDYRFPQIAANPDAALKTLRKLAVSGDWIASGTLAKLLLSDTANLEKNGAEIRAAAKFADSKNKGNTEITLLYATVLQNGIGGASDMKTAAKLLHRIADRSPEAMAQLAEFYQFGFGVEPDQKKALELTRKAASSGNPRAKIALGNRYLEGDLVKHDPAEAFRLFEEAWKSGYPRSSSVLGKCYLNGIGTRQDTARAFELFLMGANAGDPESQYQLALCFMNGKGTRQDFKSAAYWMEVASKSSHTEATRELAVCLLEGKGVAADRKSAEALLRISASKGDVKSVELLNEMVRER